MIQKKIAWTTHPLDNVGFVDSPKGKIDNKESEGGGETQTLSERTL